MDRRDAKYYEAHAQTINLDTITSSYDNARILRRLHRNDPTFNYLQITGDDSYIDENDFFFDEGDDLGWLGYFVGENSTLRDLCILGNLTLSMSKRLGAFIQYLSRNRSIETLYIGADLGSASFRQMGDFLRNNNNLRELSFGSVERIGIDCARSIAFMLSQCQQSNLRMLSFEESDASEEVLAEIVTAISSHPHLEELNLGINNLGRDGSVALGNALQACSNPRLQDLILYSNSIDDEGIRTLVAGMRNCHNLSKLDLSYNESITADGFRSLSTLFQSEHCHLKHLDLSCMNIENDGAFVISQGLAILNSLETLYLSGNAIGHDGVSALAARMVNLPSLEKLYLGNNSIGDDGVSALADGLINLNLLEALNLSSNSIGDDGARALADGLSSLNSLRGLHFRNNSISDLGLQALVEGLVSCDNLKDLSLCFNRAITASGLSSLSTLLRSESCSLVNIYLEGIPFGDDGAVALADALKGNKSMKKLSFGSDSTRVTSVGWSAFSKLLCDTSSVNNTYLSNHSLEIIGGWNNEGAPYDVKALLDLNKYTDDEHVPIHKILKSHPDFNIEPFFEWKLKLLPIVVSWFDRVRNLADDHNRRVESAQVFQSRQLSTMYNFVRGMPLVAIDGYRSRNDVAVLAPSRKRKIEQLCQ